MNNKYKIGDKVMVFNTPNILYGVVEDVQERTGEWIYAIYDSKTNARELVKEIDLLPHIEEDIKAKFNKGDKVRAIGTLAIDGKHNRLGVIERVIGEESWVLWETDIGEFSCRVPNNELELIEEDTTEEEQVTMHEHISDNDAKVNVFGQEPIPLDYQAHYEALLEEHRETKELLEIAKAALKLTSELI